MPLNMRRNAAHLSTAERDAFIAAILKMKQEGNPKSGRCYDTFVQMHQQTLFSYLTLISDSLEQLQKTHGVNAKGFISYAHSSPAFLPWHRALLHWFEMDLQQISEDPTMTIPYWDSTDKLGADSPVFQSDFLGGNGVESQGWKVMDGPFAADGEFGWTLNIKAKPSRSSESGYPLDADGCLRRAFGIIPTTKLIPKLAYVTALPSKEAVAAAYQIESYGPSTWDNGIKDADPHTFRLTIEKIHGQPHLWSGGNGIGSIADLSTSPNDPLFFLHHANVDRWYANWQAQHPNAGYPVAQPIAGLIGQGVDEAMFPFGRPIKHYLSIENLGYQYDNSNASI